MEKALDGSYTRMLRKALNVHWSERMPNVTLYGKLLKLSDKIAARRLRLEPTVSSYGNPPMDSEATYVDQLKRDTGTSTSGELAAMMNDRLTCRKTVDSRLRSRK